MHGTMTPTFPLAGVDVEELDGGREEWRPRPPSTLLSGLVPMVRGTAWPTRGASGNLAEDVDLFDDLMFCHTVRGVALLTLLAHGTNPTGKDLEHLRWMPAIRPADEDQGTDAEVWLGPALHLRVGLVALCPPQVRLLLQGRIDGALTEWPLVTAGMCADLARWSGPTPVEGESLANRHYGADVAAALFATFVGVEALRWPIAASWAVSSLATEWLSWATSVKPGARRSTAGFKVWPSLGTPHPNDRPRHVAPPADWQDVVLAG